MFDIGSDTKHYPSPSVTFSHINNSILSTECQMIVDKQNMIFMKKGEFIDGQNEFPLCSNARSKHYLKDCIYYSRLTTEYQ